MELRIFVEPHHGATYGDIVDFARIVEDYGFEGFFRSDHYLTMGQWSGLPGPTDAWVTLAGLAVQTNRIRIGTLMTASTFRLPGPLAVMAAQVDQMSGGRVELGIGAGWYAAEHAAYGIPFPPVAERFERLAEQLDVLSGMWGAEAGKPFGFAGKYYTVADCPGLPKPAQRNITGRPALPIIIGGFGARRTPQLAARHADEFNIDFRSLDDSALAFRRVRDAMAAAGRDRGTMRLSAAQIVCCGRSDRQVTDRLVAARQDASALARTGLAGSPAQVVDKLGALADAGASRVYLAILDLDDLAHMELIASQVLPQVAPLRAGDAGRDHS